MFVKFRMAFQCPLRGNFNCSAHRPLVAGLRPSSLTAATLPPNLHLRLLGDLQSSMRHDNVSGAKS